MGMAFEFTEEDRKLLSRCYTEHLKENFLWTDISGEIQEACEGKMLACYRGGTSVLFQPISEEDITSEQLEEVGNGSGFGTLVR